MPSLRTPERRRLRISLPILAACLAVPVAALAEEPGRDRVASLTDDDPSEAAFPPTPTSLITAQNVSGVTGDAIPLALRIDARPGRSVASTYLLGLPKGARLSDADHAVTAADEKAVIDVTDWDLPQLAVTLSPAQAGSYTLAVVAVSRPENGEPMNFTRSTFVLDATSAPRDAAPRPERLDKAAAREAIRPVPAALPPAPAPRQVPAPVDIPKPRGAALTAEVFIPEAPANLVREPAPRAAAPRPAGAQPSASLAAPAAVAPAITPPAASRPAAPSAPVMPTATPAAATPAAATPAAAPPAATPAVPAVAAVAAPVRSAEPDGKALVARAERLIRTGDISGARLVLERAADRGDPRATFLLAQTCDPRMLRVWNVQGLRPDPDRARALYAKAAQEGLREAKPLAEVQR
ncbi:SEL1-like repeat protein [Methylobacterium planeticum]|uniref:Sel1 repeat family protein n=1 Tax=Methylobacterium planeticum TaxID=2615211 RepID=A0A6N6MT82_9HYPH|nr:hypothetical protein [Methylobacterium planeticum]KAB1073755.1 hypothetical protein F6X51_11255 [Methylobacterium planeticum]